MSAAIRQGGGVSVRVRLSDGAHREIKTFVLRELDFERLGVRPKTEITREKYEEIESAAEYGGAFLKGAELLAYGANSRSALERKLKKRGFSPDAASSAADELAGGGLINEENDAAALARAYVVKGYGKRRIIMKLRERGYGDDSVRAALDSVADTDFVSICADVIRKKYRILPNDRKEREKIIAAMCRYGYSLSEIRDAFDIL